MLYTLRFFFLQNAVCFIMLICLVSILFTFYIQGVLKLKKIIPAPKGYLATLALGTAVAQWLMCGATNRKFAGSIPVGVIGIFQ